MPPSVRSEDPENPKSSHPRCRFLDYCLVITLVLLTIAVGSLCVLYVTWERPGIESTIFAKLKEDPNVLQGRGAQLVVKNSVLRNGTLEWIEFGVTNTFKSPYFKLEDRELKVEKSGYYFLFSQMVLKCVSADQCQKEKEVYLSIQDAKSSSAILEVNLHIKTSSMKEKIQNQLSSISGGIRYLSSGNRIRAELNTSHEMTDWKFDRDQSVLGLFWISDRMNEELETSDDQK